MNFIRGQIEGGVFRFAGGATNGQAAAPSEIAVGAAIPTGPAVLGVRPEDVVAREDGCRLGNVTCDVVEHMGHETMAHFALAGGQHVARLAADVGVQPGDRLTLAIRPGAFHLFADADGRRLN